ncbi:MAG TPA: NAD-dependent epimerase/dehydratase family protein [Planctomycetota bacterium]|nr:NAD-dependent epimerase/dehydratase family protein [Planctomycetota bacterium]
MRVLIIGGSGLISVGIVTALRARGAEVTIFNRGRRAHDLPVDVQVITGDRERVDEFVAAVSHRTWDVVIDMICFTPAQADASVRAFSGRCQQFIFCSTVCTYGVKIPSGVLIDEDFRQEPISGYGRDKLACERRFMRAHADGAFACTIVRPSHTYGEGSPLIDQLEFDPVAWDRIARREPVLCADSAIGLWQATHRDDCGAFFAGSCLNPATYGRAYNAVREEVFTWRDYYRQVGEALGVRPRLVSMPADWLVAQARGRFHFLAEISRFHGAYDTGRARRDVPSFHCQVRFVDGARRTLADVRRRGAWKDARGDTAYQALVQMALGAGVEPVEA